MFLLEKTYDIDEILKHNMHTHSVYSLCSKREMVFEDMIKSAEKAGLETLAITDHSDPGSNIDVYADNLDLRKRLEKINTDVRVLIGSELSSYGIGKFADDDKLNSSLDYRSYSCVHYHLSSWEHPEDRSPRGYAKHMLDMMSALFDAKRADCVAHPFSPGKFDFYSDEEKHLMLASITDNELGDIMAKGEESECAFEIHRWTFLAFPEFSRRFFNIGREVGAHFNYGADAHNLAGISTEGLAEEFKKIIK